MAKSRLYGVPVGAPAICQENARKDEAVRSIAGSTVEYDCTKSLYTALPLNCAKTTPLGGHETMLVKVPLGASRSDPQLLFPTKPVALGLQYVMYRTKGAVT